jgi:hypothetical protein
MTHFEPNPTDKILQVFEGDKEHLLSKLSDEDLLLELRRRKRLARVQTEYVLEGWRRYLGYEPPREYIISKLMKEAGHEVGRQILSHGVKLTGMKIEEGYFEIPGRPRMRDYHTKDLRYFIPFNFVVEKP